MPNLIDTHDRYSRRVYMTWERWDIHVLKPKPWMHEYEHLVHLAIENPTYIHYDADYENREVFYREGLIPDTGELLKVVIEFDDNGEGRVVTVYPTTKTKPGEQRKWPQ